jgi:hypothetical protein
VSSEQQRGAVEVKKMIIGAAVFVAALAALRRFGPALGERAMRKCEEMFDRMPEEFLPKRMMHSLEELREQNSRILRDLDEERTSLAAAPGGRG